MLFVSRTGENRPISRVQAHRCLKAVCRITGIDLQRVSTHSMRRSFAHSIYEMTGHDLILTQRALGHLSPLVTATYLETTESQVDEVVRAIGR